MRTKNLLINACYHTQQEMHRTPQEMSGHTEDVGLGKSFEGLAGHAQFCQLGCTNMQGLQPQFAPQPAARDTTQQRGLATCARAVSRTAPIRASALPGLRVGGGRRGAGHGRRRRENPPVAGAQAGHAVHHGVCDHSSQTSSDATGSHLRKRARTGPTVCKSTRGGAVRQQVCGRLGAQQVCLPHRWRSPERRLGDGADEVVQQLCVKVYPRSAW